jgi:superfamily I DNA/RNA helicase
LPDFLEALPCHLVKAPFPPWDSTPSPNMDCDLNGYVRNAFEKRNHYQEERRLFYVALTRAKKRLFLISQFESSSRFLKEIKESHQVEIKYKLESYSHPGKNTPNRVF